MTAGPAENNDPQTVKHPPDTGRDSWRTTRGARAHPSAVQGAVLWMFRRPCRPWRPLGFSPAGAVNASYSARAKLWGRRWSRILKQHLESCCPRQCGVLHSKLPLRQEWMQMLPHPGWQRTAGPQTRELLQKRGSAGLGSSLKGPGQCELQHGAYRILGPHAYCCPQLGQGTCVVG